MNKENNRILSIANPTLATEWHPSKNVNLTPHDITIGSGKKVWWLCSKNPQHEWEAKVLNRGKGNGCPYCSGNKVSQDNCLQTLNPKLAKEWHPSKNGTLTPNEVTTGSNRKVWWLCPKNESHSWQAVISSRHTGGHGCPYCSGKLTSEENSLATLNQMLAKEWHPSKNGRKTPNDFTVNSGKKVWWQCHINPLHEWQAVIASRNNGHGCPECGREKTEKSRKKIIEEKSLGLLRPDLLNEWHYEHNQDISPFSIASKSSIRVWWRCSVNQEHEWKTTISVRVNGSKCPYCIRRLSTPFTSLAFVNPLLADEWHPKKNKGLTPDDVMPSSGKKVWWQCQFNPDHTWQATIANRHGRGDRCPHCHSATSFSEQAILFYLKQIFLNISNREMINDDTDKKEVDIYIPSILLGIEFDGYYYHKNRVIQDNEKNKFLSGIGIQLIRIREKPLKEMQDFSCVNHLVEPNNFDELEKAIHFIMDYILENYILTEIEKLSIKRTKENVNIKEDRYKIYEQYSLHNKEKNLNDLYPETSKEWHPTKNGKLKPNHVTYASNKVVWWICPKKHEYQRSVSERTSNKRKGGCPYCAGKRVDSTNSLAAVNPTLAKEWHPTLNNDLTPHDVVPGSQKKVWWICGTNPNHLWEALINSRNRGKGCPYCTGRKIGLDNSLLAKNPEAATLWHPIKNGELSSSDVAPNSHLRVWWQCTTNHKHEWEAIISHINKGSGCPECAKVVRKQKALETKALSQYTKLQGLAKEKEGILLSPHYLGARVDHDWKCKIGHEFKMKPRNLLEKQSWCPTCKVTR